MNSAIKAAHDAIDKSTKIVEEIVAMIDRAPSVPEAKLVSYLEQENAVLHAKMRRMEVSNAEHIKDLRLALHNIRAIAKREQEKETGLHMTVLGAIEKQATQALQDGEEDVV